MTKQIPTQQKKTRASLLIAKPRVSTDQSAYCWSGIAVKHDNTKKWGLYATKMLPVGLLIPYGGVQVSLREGSSICKSATRTYTDGSITTHADYLLDAQASYGVFLDAHPRKYPVEEKRYGWIGSLVNEPSSNQVANSRLVVIDKALSPFLAKQFAQKKYPSITNDVPAFVELMDEVEPHQEITCVYGYSARSHKRLAYVHGKDCYETEDEFQRRIRNPLEKSNLQIKRTRSMNDEVWFALSDRRHEDFQQPLVATHKRSEKQRKFSMRNIRKLNAV